MNISTRAIVLNILNQLASIQYPPIDLNPPIYLVPTHLMYNLFFIIQYSVFNALFMMFVYVQGITESMYSIATVE